MVVNIVQKLTELGFSTYEARAYISLLENHPATAYETAKASGIPTSKIYEVLAKLLEREVVLELAENSKKRYIPLEPEKFVESFKSRINMTLSSLEVEFLRIKKETNVSYIWNLSDYSTLVQQGKRIISHAKASLLISLWREELDEIIEILKLKEKEGVPIAIVHFGKPVNKVGTIFPHPIEDTLYSEKGGRGFVLVSDAKEALMGTVFKNNKVEGAWSENRGFVTLAEDYIKHDVYIMKIVKRFNQTLIDRFGEKYAKLRDIFKDEEENNT
ncbi:MAG: TrmB family transcriptional regulator [Spirochaetales bacterium]|nr:TrmB family transcriptional regulator [Spirochaetales bacterium]